MIVNYVALRGRLAVVRPMLCVSPRSQSTFAQDFRLNVQKVGLDRRRAAKPPQQRCQTQHELAFDRRSCIIIGDDRRFEGLVILRILDAAPRPSRRSIRGERRWRAMTACLLRFAAGAAQRVTPVGLDLAERRHGEAFRR